MIELRVMARVTGIQAEPRFYGESMTKRWRVDFETGTAGRDKAHIYLQTIEEARQIQIGKAYELSVSLTPGDGVE